MTLAERRARARELYADGEGLSIREIAEQLGVSPGTAHRDVNPDKAENYRRTARDWKRRNRSTTRQEQTQHAHHH